MYLINNVIYFKFEGQCYMIDSSHIGKRVTLEHRISNRIIYTTRGFYKHAVKEKYMRFVKERLMIDSSPIVYPTSISTKIYLSAVKMRKQLDKIRNTVLFENIDKLTITDSLLLQYSEIFELFDRIKLDFSEQSETNGYIDIGDFSIPRLLEKLTLVGPI